MIDLHLSGSKGSIEIRDVRLKECSVDVAEGGSVRFIRCCITRPVLITGGSRVKFDACVHEPNLTWLEKLHVWWALIRPRPDWDELKGAEEKDLKHRVCPMYRVTN